MNEETFTKRAATVVALSEALGRRMSGDSVAIYVRATSRIPDESFARGVNKAAEQCRFMPTPNEFQELSGWRPASLSADEVNSAWQKRWGTQRV